MGNLFSAVLNMSMTGSIVILLVMLARHILKPAPKIFSYALWAVVLFRLLCPVALTGPVSVLNVLKPEGQAATEATSVIYFIPVERNENSDAPFVSAENPSAAPVPQSEPVGHTKPDIMQSVSYVWITGTGLMLLYSVIQYFRLRQKLVGAIPYNRNVYCADYIDTPFVMGIFNPKIYLPFDVPVNERKYIIAHEQHHIARFDHILKLLAYVTLCIHWFNPLAWVAFLLAGRDMEMSCDEAVIRKLGSQIRADYSASLLRLATHKKIIAGMPLAFGEGDTKGRIMNMARWKQPRLWVSMACLLLCAAILVACAVNPETASSSDGTDSTAFSEVEGTDVGLNIHKEPNILSDIVDYYPNGETITISEIQDGWGRTAQGWVFMDYVTMTDDVTGIVTVPNTANTGTLSTISGSDVATDVEWIQYGDLRLLLPPGLEATNENGILTLTMDAKAVGGVALRKPDDPSIYSVDWLKKIGISEASDTAMGYMSGSSTYADYEITFFPDTPVNQDANGNIIADEQGTYVLENETTHYFFNYGTDAYDIWFYNHRIPNTIREALLKTCILEGGTDISAMQAALKKEQDALQQCRSVLERIQRSAACKIETKQENGPDARNETTLITSWIYGQDRLHIALNSEGGGASRFGGMLVNGTKYEYDAPQQWHTVSQWEWEDPWLTRFQWEDSVVAYQDTRTDDSGITVMLRIDQPFAGSGNQQPHYFVCFDYNTDGSFRDVYVQANLFMDNSISKTESVVSLDSAMVEGEIQKEYQKAVGR